MKTTIIALGLALALGGCVSREQLMLQDGNACRGYGYTQGSDAYASCMQTRDIQRDQARAAALQSFSASMQQLNQNYQQQQMINALNRPLTTHCNSFYGQTNCTTY
jgi:hypothetical protein